MTCILQQGGAVERLRQLARCDVPTVMSAASGCLANLTSTQAKVAVDEAAKQRDAALSKTDEMKRRLEGLAVMSALAKASAEADKAALLEVARAEASVAQRQILQQAKQEAEVAWELTQELQRAEAAAREACRSFRCEAAICLQVSAEKDMKRAKAEADAATARALESAKREAAIALVEANAEAEAARFVAVHAAVARTRAEAEEERAAAIEAAMTAAAMAEAIALG